MTDPFDWEHIRKHKFATVAPPDDWPPGLKVISQEGLDLFGIDKDNKLFWDGKELLIRQTVSLRWFELILAVFVATSSVTIAAIETIQFCGDIQ